VRLHARRYPITLLLLLAAGCGGSWEEFRLASLPTAATYPGAPAVVLLDDVRVEFHADARTGKPVADYRHHRRVRILTEAGRPEAHLAVFYWPGFRDLISFRARTISPEGTSHGYGRADAADLMAIPKGVFHADQRALVLEARPSTPGTVVEVETVHREIDPRLFHAAQRFNYGLPAAYVRFEVKAPREWQVESLARQQGEDIAFAPRITHGPGETTYLWEARNVPAWLAETHAPPDSERALSVAVRLREWREGERTVSGPASAQELSAYAHSLLEERDANAPVELRAQELVKDLPPDPLTRARRLHAFVRDNILYCAIEIGYGGWRPHRADEVLRLRYGDCKDKANLLKEMLAAVGIRSRLALIFAHSGAPRRFGLPTVAGNFNHAIVLVDLPGGQVLADPTARTVPLGALPRGDQGAEVLPTSAQGEQILVAPASPPRANEKTLEADLTLRGDELHGEFSLLATGTLADQLRAGLLEARDSRDPITSEVALKQADVSAQRIANGPPPENPTPLEVRGRIRVPHAVTSAGTSTILRLTDFCANEGWVLRPGPRESPLVLGAPRRSVQRLRISLAGLASPDPPPAITIEHAVGRYQISWRVAGQVLTIERILELRQPVVPARAYQEARRFFDAVAAADARPVVLRRTGP
jgi:transglutaminase-like putative cysteine protease